jgi:thiol-disulfide isomerase/thioredoxin
MGKRWRRSRTLRFAVVFVVIAAVASSVALALSSSGGSSGTPAMNNPVPGVNLSNLIHGEPAISTASLEGRAVVLNFWGSWCPPCQREMPALQAAHRQLGDRVTFIGVDEQDGRSAAISFLRGVGVTYTIGFDGDGHVASSFDVVGFPTTFFISHGRELFFVQGELTKATLRQNLRQWFGV